MSLSKAGLIVLVALASLAVTVPVRGVYPPHPVVQPPPPVWPGPVNTGVWVQTQPVQYWTWAYAEGDANSAFQSDFAGGPPPVSGPTSGASKHASASITGASAQADSTILLAVNPDGQTVMQSMFELTDSVMGKASVDCTYYAAACAGGSLTVAGTLSTASAGVTGKARVDLGWSANTNLATFLPPARGIGAVMTFGSNQLTIGVSNGYAYATGVDGNGNQFTRVSTSPIDSLSGELSVGLDEFTGYVPRGAPGSIVIRYLQEGFSIGGEAGESHLGSTFNGTLEIWVGSPPPPLPPVAPAPSPTPRNPTP